MSKVDQFESVFRSALHDVFEFKKIHFAKVLIVSDLGATELLEFENKIKLFSNCIDIDNNTEWLSLSLTESQTTQELIDSINKLQPDLIFTYRNLQSATWQYSHSLGEHLDVLIQKTTIPVVVVPHPLDSIRFEHTLKNTNIVMAITDHLSADDDLVNYAAKFTEKNGQLYLMHIENAGTFEKYMDAISKISTIDTDEAREQISKQLLKLPNDYIHSVEDILKLEKLPITIKKVIGFGHHLTEYRKYIEQHQVDLLVMNTKNKEQMAMHGLAYPLVVELRAIPLLLI